MNYFEILNLGRGATCGFTDRHQAGVNVSYFTATVLKLPGLVSSRVVFAFSNTLMKERQEEKTRKKA